MEQDDFLIDDMPSENVLVVSSVVLDSIKDRKNFVNTVLALKLALNDQQQVGAVLKVNSAGRGSVDKYATIKSLEKIKENLDINFPLTLFHGELGNKELASLYKSNQISTLFTLTRGEGFGLPILEAAAAGLPIIASDWSAHVEFLDDKFMKVEGKQVPIPEERKDEQIWTGGDWFEPDVIKASSVIKRFFNDEKFRSTAMDNASALQKFVENRYSLSNIIKLYDEVIKGVLSL
jgi:glycosyltransferase involved in cell wall biosynthesis